MSGTLKDCPFCGQPASLVGWGEGTGYRVHVECNSCRNATARCSHDSQAVSMWNRRVPSPEVAELRRLLKDYMACINEYKAAFLAHDARRMDAVAELRHDLEFEANKLLAKGDK